MAATLESDRKPTLVGPASKRFLPLAILLFVGVIATGLPEPMVLGRLPISSFLKNQLNCTATEISTFMLLVTMPWHILKPIFGLISDAFPIFGTRRRHYLLITTSLAALGWILFRWVPHSYTALLTACFVLNVFMAFGATVLGAVFVDAGRSLGMLGKLTSVRVIAQFSVGVVGDPLGGLIAGAGLAALSGINALVLISLLPVGYILLRERPDSSRSESPFKDARHQVKEIFRSKTIWLVLAIVVMFYFALGYGGTVQYFRQTTLFRLTDQQVGLLTGIASTFCILTALVYPSICKRWPLRTLITWAIPLFVASSVGYLFYSSNFAFNALIDIQSAIFFTFCETVIYHIAARATPVGSEGMGLSLLLGFRNLCILGGSVVGSILVDHGLPYWQLLTADGITTLCLLFLIPLLPATLLRTRDPERAIP